MNVCTNFHSNPSKSCCDNSVSTHIAIPSILAINTLWDVWLRATHFQYLEHLCLALKKFARTNPVSRFGQKHQSKVIWKTNKQNSIAYIQYVCTVSAYHISAHNTLPGDVSIKPLSFTVNQAKWYYATYSCFALPLENLSSRTLYKTSNFSTPYWTNWEPLPELLPFLDVFTYLCLSVYLRDHFLSLSFFNLTWYVRPP